MVRNKFWYWILTAQLLISVEAWSQAEKNSRESFLLFRRSDEQGIAAKIRSDIIFRGVHDLVLRTADEILREAPVFYELKGKRLLDKATKARKRIFYLSYAWRMTRNQAYAQRAKKEMVAVAGFPDWNPSHFLDVAEITMALAIGLDWLDPILDPGTKKIISQAIITKGLKVSFEKQNSWWADKDTNWNPICNAGMVFGAIVTKDLDEDLHDRIIRRALSSVRLAMAAYEPDGVYPEGYTYWSYGTTFLVMLLDALEGSGVGTFGPETYPGFYRTAGYLQHMIGPTGMNFNYSDGVSNCSVNPAMFWLARRSKDHAVLSAELNMMRTLKSMSWIPELPMLLVWGYTMDLTGKAHPSEREFVGKGKNPVAMFRSEWTDQAMYIGLKAGSPAVSHGHMDAGSFILDALGERWAIDPGKQDYNALESKGMDIWSFKQNADRWKVLRNNNLSHNTLTFNGQLQYVQGQSTIVSVVNKANLRGAVADLSGVYPYAALGIRRGVALSGRDVAIVRDEISTRSGPEASMQWTMLTPATVNLTASDRAELILNGKKLFMAVTGSGAPKLETWSTSTGREYDEPLTGCVFIGFKTTLPANKILQFEVIFSTKEIPAMRTGLTPALREWKP